jgi:hypothetical protein
MGPIRGSSASTQRIHVDRVVDYKIKIQNMELMQIMLEDSSPNDVATLITSP